MLEKGTKLWFINNHTGKIDSVIVSRAGRQNFSFISRRKTFRAEYDTIGRKYFRTIDALMESQKKRREMKNAETDEEMEEEMEDITLECIDCGKKFIFNVSDQLFFAEKGFAPPVRCKTCRAKKKALAK